MARDIYTRLNEIDDASLTYLAGMLERRGNHPQQVAIRAAYLDGLGDISGLQVLEIGCGTGVVSRDLLRRIGPAGRLVASDPSPAMIETARRLAQAARLPGEPFEIGDARALPYPDGAFDLACAVTVLSHVPEREQVLRELARVTRPGGRVLIVDGDFSSNQLEHPDRELTARIAAAWRMNVVDDPYLTRRLGPLADAAGLLVESVNGYIHVEAGRVDPETSFILAWTGFAGQQAVAAGAATEAEVTAWVRDFHDLNERNLLFGSVSFIGMVCRRP